MKEIETIHAVGHVLCHDLTQIIPGQYKGARFRKGHVVTEEDIPVLLSMGKEHLFVWEKPEGFLHEDEGAARLAALCENEHITKSEAREGKILSLHHGSLYYTEENQMFLLFLSLPIQGSTLDHKA